MGKDSVMQVNSLSPAVEVWKEAGLRQDASDTGEGEEKEVTLSSLFSENKEAMDLFLALCFMFQRINTGGININALGALHNIKDRLVEDHQFEPGTLEFVISAINDNTNMYKLFAEGSPEFQYIQRQLPSSYCEIMAKNISDKPGFLLKLNLIGDVESDLKSIQSLLNIFLSTHTTDILSVSSDSFSFEPANPWSITYDVITRKMVVPDNTIVIAFHHRQDQASSYFAIKALVTIKRWLLRRLPVEDKVDEDVGIKERPTAQDEMLDRQAFLGIKSNSISLSGSRPYSAKAPNSGIVNISDVVEEDEYYEAEDNLQGNVQIEVEGVNTTGGKIKGLFGKTKGLLSVFNKQSKQTTDEIILVEEHDGYHISLVDYNGNINTYFDLIWSIVEEDAHQAVLQDIYKQIFMACPIASLSPIKVNVKQSIRGRWLDAAQGYLMVVDYNIAQPEE